MFNGANTYFLSKDWCLVSNRRLPPDLWVKIVCVRHPLVCPCFWKSIMLHNLSRSSKTDMGGRYINSCGYLPDARGLSFGSGWDARGYDKNTNIWQAGDENHHVALPVFAATKIKPVSLSVYNNFPRLDLAKQSNSMYDTFSKNASPKYVNSKNTALSPPPWTQRSVGVLPFSR